jgi:hypothetical protein
LRQELFKQEDNREREITQSIKIDIIVCFDCGCYYCLRRGVAAGVRKERNRSCAAITEFRALGVTVSQALLLHQGPKFVFAAEKK